MNGDIKKINGIYPVTITKAVYLPGTNKTINDIIGKEEITFNNPLLKGAKGDGVSLDDNFIVSSNYFEEGHTFLLSKSKAIELYNNRNIGNGLIRIEGYYNNTDGKEQGEFPASYIEDPIIMAMNIPNKVIPNGAQEKQKNGAWYSFNTIPYQNYKKVNGWGQIFIQESKSYPELTRINITNLKLIGHFKSSNKWALLTDPTHIKGAFYKENFSDQISKPATYREIDGGIQVDIDSSSAGHCFHFWTESVELENTEDLDYIVVSCNCWSDSNEDIFCFSMGADYKNGIDIKEVGGGRFKKVTNIPSTNYFTNLTTTNYFKLCNKDIIDGIKSNVNSDDGLVVKSLNFGEKVRDTFLYNTYNDKFLIKKNRDFFKTKDRNNIGTIEDMMEINALTKVYVPSKIGGEEEYVCKLGTLILKSIYEYSSINIEVFSDASNSIYGNILITAYVQSMEKTPLINIVELGSAKTINMDKKIFTSIKKSEDTGQFIMDIYLSKFPNWTTFHIYIDSTSSSLDAFKINEYIRKPYSNYQNFNRNDIWKPFVDDGGEKKYLVINSTAGIESNKPNNMTNNLYDIGTTYYNTTTDRPLWWNGSKWVDHLNAIPTFEDVGPDEIMEEELTE